MLDAVVVPCPGVLIFCRIADYAYDICPLSNPECGHSVLVCNVMLSIFISILVYAAACLYCRVGVQFSPYVIASSTPQAYGMA